MGNEYIEENSRHSIITKILIVIWILAFAYWIYSGMKPEEPYIYADGSVLIEPVQKNISSKDTITVNIDNQYVCIIYPKASYNFTAKVKNVNTFNPMDPVWRPKLSKYDIGIVWGKLADPYYDQYISYSQANRYLSWRYTYEIGLDSSYINSHIANNHIIPANENVLKAISKIKVNDIIYLEGKLVNCDIKSGDRLVGTLTTSLVRNDGGNGACENFYVEKVILGDETYE